MDNYEFNKKLNKEKLRVKEIYLLQKNPNLK